jgi:hypothetical protein
MIRSWLNIQDPQGRNFYIQGLLDFDANAIKNEIWYRGDSEELLQLYRQLGSTDGSFWSSVPGNNRIRKIHTGLPGLIADTLTDIVIQDMAEVLSDKRQVEIDEIVKENNFKDLISEAVSCALVKGDGAFKINFDLKISDNPLIEFYSGDRVDFIYKRGKYVETVFKNYHEVNNVKYVHLETYGFGYIKNEVRRLDNDHKVDISAIPKLIGVEDVSFAGYIEDAQGNVLAKGLFNMAIPFKIFKSAKYENRGKSIFENKIGDFDALDEIVSQWLDAIRKGRATSYIPKSLIPRDPKTGESLLPNSFEHTYIEVKGGMQEDGEDKVQVTQPIIPSSNYMESYITYLDLCLQGLISPSTLGIDTKKLDNAEAQREKEKMTLYTRGKIVSILQEILPMILDTALKAWDVFNLKSVSDEDLGINIEFGEYANPSFEAVVETVAKAKQARVMSTKKVVDELYGDSMTPEEKQEEVKLILEEEGVVELEEPGMNTPDVQATDDGVVEDIESSTNLNGAQIASLLKIVEQNKNGLITRSSAISIITNTLGISREAAESFIEMEL